MSMLPWGRRPHCDSHLIAILIVDGKIDQIIWWSEGSSNQLLQVIEGASSMLHAPKIFIKSYWCLYHCDSNACSFDSIDSSRVIWRHLSDCQQQPINLDFEFDNFASLHQQIEAWGFQIHGVIRLTRHMALAWSAQDSLLSTTPHLYETEGLLLKSPAHWCIGACLIEHSRFSVLLETVSYYEYRNRLISFHDRNLVISSTHLKINHGSETSESSIGVIESASRSSSGFQFSYSSSTIMDRAHQHQHQLYSMHSIGITSLSKST